MKSTKPGSQAWHACKILAFSDARRHLSCILSSALLTRAHHDATYSSPRSERTDANTRS